MFCPKILQNLRYHLPQHANGYIDKSLHSLLLEMGQLLTLVKIYAPESQHFILILGIWTIPWNIPRNYFKKNPLQQEYFFFNMEYSRNIPEI